MKRSCSGTCGWVTEVANSVSLLGLVWHMGLIATHWTVSYGLSSATLRKLLSWLSGRKYQGILSWKYAHVNDAGSTKKFLSRAARFYLNFEIILSVVAFWKRHVTMYVLRFVKFFRRRLSAAGAKPESNNRCPMKIGAGSCMCVCMYVCMCVWFLTISCEPRHLAQQKRYQMIGLNLGHCLGSRHHYNFPGAQVCTHRANLANFGP